MFVQKCIFSALICIQLAMAAIEDKFQEHGIVPDVIPTAPKEELKVIYSDRTVDFGNEFEPAAARSPPTSFDWDAEPDALYSVILTDPDAPSRANPIRREWRHWLVINVIGKDLTTGQTLTNYVGPGPPPTTGLHRYVFLVYKQKGQITDNEWDNKNRPKWSVANFAKKHDLGDPVAGNFFQAQNPLQ